MDMMKEKDLKTAQGPHQYVQIGTGDYQQGKGMVVETGNNMPNSPRSPDVKANETRKRYKSPFHDSRRLETGGEPDVLYDSKYQFGSVKVSIVQQNIITAHVDAIVNAANGHLRHGAGVAAAIADAAGRSFLEDGYAYVRENGSVKVGSCYAQSSAGKLKERGIKFVIHAVGPSMHEVRDAAKCQQLLIAAVKSSLEEADRLGCTSIALPAISSGLFGVPMEVCTLAYYIAAKIVCEPISPKSLCDVQFMNIDERTTQHIGEAFYGYEKDPELPAQIETYRMNRETTSNLAPGIKTRTSIPGVLQNDQWRSNKGKAPSSNLPPARPDHQHERETSAKTNLARMGDDGGPSRASAECKKQAPSGPLPTEPSPNVPIGSSVCSVPESSHVPHHDNARAVKPQREGRNVTGHIAKPDFSGQPSQPEDGTMSVKHNENEHLPGYDNHGTIEIQYNFSPRKGRTSFAAFLPRNEIGLKLLPLLEAAFDKRLTFVVNNKRELKWGSIPHKTSKMGGPQSNGYPDPEYLTQLERELRAAGLRD